MRTIIVYERDNKLSYQELGDVGHVPAVGESLVMSGARYRVVDIHTSPALYKSDGKTKRTGFDRLLEILTVLYGDAKDVEALVRSLESIGSADRPQMSGSIILPGKGVSDFDDLIYVRLKLLSEPFLNLPELIVTVQSLLGTSVSGSEDDASGLTPILLDGESAADDGAAS